MFGERRGQNGPRVGDLVAVGRGTAVWGDAVGRSDSNDIRTFSLLSSVYQPLPGTQPVPPFKSCPRVQISVAMCVEGAEGILERLKATEKLTTPGSFDISDHIDRALLEHQMNGLPECIFGDLTDIEYSEEDDEDEVEERAAEASCGEGIGLLRRAALDHDEAVTVTVTVNGFPQ